MIRRPPRSTLFPYTRSSDLQPPGDASRAGGPGDGALGVRGGGAGGLPVARVRGQPPDPAAQRAAGRSEEHTSELQSRQYLVCRLLLEKKKNKYISVRRIEQV